VGTTVGNTLGVKVGKLLGANEGEKDTVGAAEGTSRKMMSEVAVENDAVVTAAEAKVSADKPFKVVMNAPLVTAELN
jgi:hypothetical protein